MARPLRIQYEGAWYHVMNRGLNRRLIYHNDCHRQIFLTLLADIHQRFDVQTHAYCLMDNHYHLILHTPRSNLSRAMRHLDGLYTQRFNRNENRDGALFRGRYKSILIDANDYLLQLSRYIHLNPVAAHMVDRAEDFEWSSYQAYLEMVSRPSWLYCDEILSQSSQNGCILPYKEFVQQGIDQEMSALFSKKHFPSILGDGSFVDLIKTHRMKKNHIDQEIPDLKKLNKPFDMHGFLGHITSHYGINTVEIQRRGNRFVENSFRNIIIYFAATYCDFRHKEIAEAMGDISHIGVAQIKYRMHIAIKSDLSVLKEVEKLKKIFQCNK